MRKFASRGNIKEFTELLLRDCPPQCGDGEGLTALHYACAYDKPKVLETIFNIAADKIEPIDAKDRYGWTPLYCAAHHGSQECVQILLEKGADPSVQNKAGKSSIHAAASRGRTAIMDMLLNAGASLNQQDNLGMTPLHDAAYRGQPNIYNIFATRNNADVFIQDSLGYTAADYLK